MSFLEGPIEKSDLGTVERLHFDPTRREELSTFCLIGCFLLVSPTVDSRTYRVKRAGIPGEENRRLNAGRKAFITVVARIEDEYNIMVGGVSAQAFDALVRVCFFFPELWRSVYVFVRIPFCVYVRS